MSAISKETIDSISSVLVQDERTLSVREKELLTNLLHTAQQQTGHDRIALIETIHRAVGETVAHRAYGILGQSIAQRLAAEPIPRLPDTPRTSHRDTLHMPPKPPSPMPPSPGPGPGKSLAMPPQPPGPMPPSPGGGPGYSAKPGTAELPGRLLASEILPAKYVLLDEFLSPTELAELMTYTLAHERDFQTSEVISPGVKSLVDFEYRRSRVLMDLGKFQEMIGDKLLTALPGVLPRLNCRPFPVLRVEMQITASGDGEFFRCHADNAHEEISSRQVTLVYFFHREPKPFQGGELKLYDSQWQEGGYAALESSRSIVPQQNQMVVFMSSLMHEVVPVHCPGGQFADSRFTVNGWLHR